MTNSKKGLLSELKPHTANYVTAAGPLKANAKGTYRRTVYGSNGESVTFTGEWTYNEAIPFDIAGEKDLIAISQNGAPYTVHVTADITMLVDSTGVGMGSLSRALSPLETAVLDHVLKGHCSLRRQWETRQRSTGGLPITLAGLKEFAKVGCDLCNAFKLKLTDPRSKTRDTSSDQSADTCSLLYYDQFGRVEQPSAQFGYHYAHLFSSPKKNIAWLHGSKPVRDHSR